jgi:hypothetical protein
MQKIISKEEKLKKEKRNQLIVGGILILLMLLSTIGYALTGRNEGSSSVKVNYKGINFVKSSDYWVFSYNGNSFSTRYHPEETKNISFSNKLTLSDYTKKPLYFVSESGQPNIEIARNLNNIILRIQPACLSSSDCSGNYPVKDCSQDNVIIVKKPVNNETGKIYQSEKCVFINVNEEEETRYADAFLFSILKI